MRLITNSPQAMYREWVPSFSPRLIQDASEISRARRAVRLIVIHCSATPSHRHYSPEQLEADHLRRGFAGCGYHYYITREGWLYEMRPPERIGAHARGYNRFSIGVCYEGGLNPKMEARDTRTPAQRQMLSQLMARLKKLYPEVWILGHRDLSPDLNGDGLITPEEWTKQCPCFDAKIYN